MNRPRFGRRNRFLRTGILLIAGLPLLVGSGCPAFRNGVIDAVEVATINAVSQANDGSFAGDLTGGVLAAALQSLFDRFRQPVEP